MSPSLTRPVAPDPYSLLPPVPAFALRSDDLVDGQPLPDAHTNTPVGDNVSPHLAWSGFPTTTRSFAVSCFDPDAPGVSGWWHWTVLDVPPTTTSLPRDAGRPGGHDLPRGAILPRGSFLPRGAFQLRGDDAVAAYRGAAPPPGDQVHRYYFVVHALDVETLGAGPDTPPGQASTALVFHTLARAVLVATYRR